MKSVLVLCVSLVCMVAVVESQVATETRPQTAMDGRNQLLKMFNFQQSFISMQNSLLNLQQFVKSIDYHSLIKDVQLLRGDLNETKTKLDNTENELGKMKTKVDFTENELEKTKIQLDFTESELVNMKTKLDNTENQLESTKTKLDNTEIELEKTKTELLSAAASIEVGSTFIRWGRKTCGSHADLVYAGEVGGSHYTHTGAAANALCLTMTPELEDLNPKPKYHTYVYGAEYEHFHGHHNQDVPCAVCHTPMTTTIMVPATRSCPAGWTVQYTGYLSAGYFSHKAATEFLCLDGQPEDSSSGSEDKNGRLFYSVYTSCGSLSCPPYINNKVVTCVVCSK